MPTMPQQRRHLDGEENPASAAVLLVVSGADVISPLFQPANCPVSTP